MNDEQHLLASAYLDGELTAEQRALAQTDPDVMSEVDRLRSLQAELRSVTPPSDAAREEAIGAAMAAFTAAARPAPPVNAVTRTVEFRRRPSYARYLGLAAGVVAVGLLGFVVANAVRTGGDDDAELDTAGELLVEEPADAPAQEPAAEAADEQRDLTESAATELADDADNSEAGSDSGFADEPAADEQPASEPIDEPADEPAEEPADSEFDVVPPLIDPDRPLATPAELGAYGTYLLELQAAENLPPTPNTACPQQVILGTSEYVFDGVPIDVLVAVDEQERTVAAINPDTCETLVTGPLF